jgi:hypothetical protein
LWELKILHRHEKVFVSRATNRSWCIRAAALNAADSGAGLGDSGAAWTRLASHDENLLPRSTHGAGRGGKGFRTSDIASWQSKPERTDEESDSNEPVMSQSTSQSDNLEAEMNEIVNVLPER